MSFTTISSSLGRDVFGGQACTHAAAASNLLGGRYLAKMLIGHSSRWNTHCGPVKSRCSRIYSGVTPASSGYAVSMEAVFTSHEVGLASVRRRGWEVAGIRLGWTPLTYFAARAVCTRLWGRRR
jgi:hypothetical protein